MATSGLLPTPDTNRRGGRTNQNGHQITLQDVMKKPHLTSSPEVSPVSLFPKPGREEAQQTTVISGLKCLELYDLQNRHGSSVRMLVASLLGMKEWYSNKCVLTWKTKVTKSNRLLFQLYPSMHRTEGTGFGLLPHRRQQHGSEGDIKGMETNKTKWTTRPTNVERQSEDDSYPTSEGLEGQMWKKQQRNSRRFTTQDRGQSELWNDNWIEIATELCSLDDGLPAEMGDFTCTKAQHRTHQLKAYGNAIVPEVVLQIMKAID